MSRVCRIVLVCEGWRDSAFVRGFLKAANVPNVVPQTNPGGSGHDWVKAQFAAEVANLARYAEGRGVIGMLDEDGQGIQARQREVADRLAIRGLPPVASHEGRCLLLPTRQIETWLYWLTAQRTGQSVVVDETTDYKKAGPPAGAVRIADAQAGLAGAFLHSLNHTQLPRDCPPMLREALGDLRAFLGAVRR